MSNKIEFTESKEGLHFKVDCEDSAVLERLTHLLVPFTEPSSETGRDHPSSGYTPPEPSTKFNEQYKIVFICGKPFAWPKWLEAEYLAMDQSSDWYAFTGKPVKSAMYWSSEGESYGHQVTSELYALKLPDIHTNNWKETLTKNPWNGQETS